MSAAQSLLQKPFSTPIPPVFALIAVRISEPLLVAPLLILLIFVVGKPLWQPLVAHDFDAPLVLEKSAFPLTASGEAKVAPAGACTKPTAANSRLERT